MSKIVVLNSGGFDSVVLMNYLHYIQGEKDIHSLHFLYGALNEKQQLECVNKVCDKIGAVNKVIQLPNIDWTTSNFYTQETSEVSTQYLEYRNLIFLSFAVSYAQAIGAKVIYLALINAIGEYADTKFSFICGLNRAIEESGIVIDTPFICDPKERLGHIANYLKVKKNEYFSCDTPVNGEVCGKCADCLALEEIYKKIF